MTGTNSIIFIPFILAYALFALGAPAYDIDFTKLDHNARSILSRAVPAAPRWAIYSDAYVYGGTPATSDITGYNVFILAFYLTSGPTDNALEFVDQLTADERATVLSQYEAAGISLIVSAFGSTDTPTSSGVDPTTIANSISSWVIEYGLAGVDVDYEDFTAMDADNSDAEDWLITFTQQLRVNLPSGDYILTHAPVAPWFSPNLWSGGGYLYVDQQVGSLIDWYNVQFYNQGADEYTTCSGLLDTSSTTWPDSALFQIAASGVTLDKLVIGKPATTADASTGYMDADTLATCVQDAADQGWDAGVMVWQYPDAAASWISTVRSLAFPETGSPAPTSSSTSTAPTTSPTATSNCAGLSAWSSSLAYEGGDEVVYGGDMWQAQYWNEDSTPGGTAEVWTNEGVCNPAVIGIQANQKVAPVRPAITPAPTPSRRSYN